MDVCFDILIPRLPQLDGLEYKQPTFTWNGVSYPQGEGKFHWGQFVELLEMEIPLHLRKYIPDEFGRDNWRAFEVQGLCLSMWRLEVKEFDNEWQPFNVDWKGKSIEDFLRALLSQCDRWVVVFELFGGHIDSVYAMSVEECLQHLRKNIGFESEIEGFVAVFDSPAAS